MRFGGFVRAHNLNHTGKERFYYERLLILQNNRGGYSVAKGL